jgi:alkaline phosphatase D
VVGDPSTTRALVWARADRPATLRLEARPEAGATVVSVAEAAAGTDLTARAWLLDLLPATRYELTARFESDGREGPPVHAAFRTAPAPDTPAAVRVAVGADLGGQNACRDVEEGYPVFEVLRARAPDLFVTLGDMIYADDPCLVTGRFGNAQLPVAGPASDLEGFRTVWRYQRADPGFTALLADTPLVATWDDHETRNDAGPRDPLLPVARRAFLEWNPVLPDPASDAPLYRELRWGRHLALFVLDTRSHRDPKAEPDRAERPKTMLGAAQRDWLTAAVARSDATWKVVLSSVPLAIPTGWPAEAGRDGWANGDRDTGYERELLGLLRAWQASGVRNLVFVSADVHFATGFRFVPFPEAPDFVVHELVAGPLQAALFPNLELDPTLHPERLFFHGPVDPRAVASLADAKHWFDFAELDLDAGGELMLRIVDATGRSVFEHRLEPR